MADAPERIWAVFEAHESGKGQPRVYASASKTKGEEYVRVDIAERDKSALMEALSRKVNEKVEAQRENAELRAKVEKLERHIHLHAGDTASLNNEVELMKSHWDEANARAEDLSRQLAERDAELAQMREDRLKQIDYSCDLQRIIEDLCGGRDIREPQTTARHHYDMAISARSALSGPGDGRRSKAADYVLAAPAPAGGTE